MNFLNQAFDEVIRRRYYLFLLPPACLLTASAMDCDLTLWFYSKFGRSPKSLAGKVVWITGSSSGIGESLAYVLAAVGCKLVLCGTRVNRLEIVRKRCHELNPKLQEKDVLVLPFDMKEVDKIPAYVKQVFDHFGELHILVNNAGRTQRASFEETQLGVDKEMFEVNVFGLIALTRSVVKVWYEKKFAGQIAVTSSIAGKVGAPYSATYTATKHALHGYFESLRNESFCHGIRITMICPGPVVSEIIERAYSSSLDRNWQGSHKNDKRRMPTSRCAYLMAVAIANQLDEVWISPQPFLLYYYVSQYLPSVTRALFPRIMTKERIMRLRDGEDQTNTSK